MARVEVVYCKGVKTLARYWPTLGAWYCDRCKSRIGVVETGAGPRPHDKVSIAPGSNDLSTRRQKVLEDDLW